MAIRDRITAFRRIKASSLTKNPRNWRTHPDRQRTAMMAVLEDIGYADALIAREDEHGHIVLIDGHLRAETTPDQEVPVLILDVTEQEADALLATLDPLTALAEQNTEALDALLDGLTEESRDLADLCGLLDARAAEMPDPDPDPEPGAGGSNSGPAVTIKLTVPPRVWLVQEEEVSMAVEQMADQFGIEIGWPK